jgi:hypothetical protein
MFNAEGERLNDSFVLPVVAVADVRGPFRNP